MDKTPKLKGKHIAVICRIEDEENCFIPLKNTAKGLTAKQAADKAEKKLRKNYGATEGREFYAEYVLDSETPIYATLLF